MLRKWYIELPLLLSAIFLTTYIALQSDFELPDHLINFKRKEEQPMWCGVVSAADMFDRPDSKRWSEGKNLFKSNCASCHNPKADGTGPALQGVTARWQAAGKFKKKTGEQWLYAWVKNWHDVVDAGYPYGVSIANSRTSEMNVFSAFTDKDVDAIIFYIDNPAAQRTSPVSEVLP